MLGSATSPSAIILQAQGAIFEGDQVVFLGFRMTPPAALPPSFGCHGYKSSGCQGRNPFGCQAGRNLFWVVTCLLLSPTFFFFFLVSDMLAGTNNNGIGNHSDSNHGDQDDPPAEITVTFTTVGVPQAEKRLSPDPH